MATETQIKDFISKIAPCAVEAYRTLGKVLPSVCIGMACVESAYGTAGSVKYNSYLGQKVGTGKTATKYWDGTFFKSKTKEEYSIGVHTVITDAFRSYKSMQQCVLNYYELLNTKLYSRVFANVGYVQQMQQIKLCGYMTSSTEVNTVIKLIERYNLSEWDKKAMTQTDGKPDNHNPYTEPTKNVKYGSRGNDVRWVQFALNHWHYEKTGLILGLKVDGDFKDKTKLAVIECQKLMFPEDPKEWDGIVGSKTREKLKA
jgi:hypothetical protein